MKILMLAPYIYDAAMPEFTVNKTGFGMMVNDIAKSVACLDDVLLLTRVITSGTENHMGSYMLQSHTWKQILLSASFADWCCALKSFICSKGTIKNRLRIAFYAFDNGAVRKTIKTSKSDIVHIHGIGNITKGYIKVCEELRIPYVVTLHGLNGLNDSIAVSSEERNLERDFLIFAERSNVPVSVISSGIKKRIEDNYIHKSSNNIVVITNGVNASGESDFIEEANNKSNVYQNSFSNLNEDSITQDSLKEIVKSCKNNGKQIIFVVGNITNNKNQKQIVDIAGELNNAVVFLFGNECDNGVVRTGIAENQLQDKVILAGFCSTLDSLWEYADLNVVLSISEGFGMSIVEGYIHGIPTVTFNDLDAVPDLYDSSSMLLCDSRSNGELADTINRALAMNWDKAAIRKHGNKYSMERIAKEYWEFFDRIIAKNNERRNDNECAVYGGRKKTQSHNGNISSVFRCF